MTAPVFIGTTPGGAKWYARKPEDVDKLTERLQALWTHYNAKPLQRRRAARGT